MTLLDKVVIDKQVDNWVWFELITNNLIRYQTNRKLFRMETKPTPLFYQTLCDDLHKLKRKKEKK